MLHSKISLSILGFPGGSHSKESARNEENLSSTLGQEDPLETEWLLTPALLLGEFNGQGSPVHRLQYMGSQRVGPDGVTCTSFASLTF